MGLEVATYIASLTSSNPPGTDLRKQGDDHIRLVKSVLQATFPNATKSFYFPDSTAKVAVFAVLSTEMNKAFACSTAAGSYVATLPNLAVADAGWKAIFVKTTADVNTVTITPSAGTINGAASLILDSENDFAYVIWTGTAWLALTVATTALPIASLIVSGVIEIATTTETLTGTDATRAVSPDGLAALWEKGADIASAATITIGEGCLAHVTGTTGITDIDFSPAKDGRFAVLVFDGILLLTHHATTLPLPGSANITTAAGDIMLVWQDNGDNIKTAYFRISGASVVAPVTASLTLLGNISTASGASASLGSLDLTTYKFLRLVFKSVSSSSIASFLVGNSTADDVVCTTAMIGTSGSDALNGMVDLDLTSGRGFSVCSVDLSSTSGFVAACRAHLLTSASTQISVAPSAGNFDGGSIDVWGWK